MQYVNLISMRYDFMVGVDTGVQTGYALWNMVNRCLAQVDTLAVHDVILQLHELSQMYTIKVRIEDARKRKWVQGGREKLQGVGSVKRDAKILEDFCKAKGIAYELVAPKDNRTKMDAGYFARLTGWNEKCSVHARDAAMLVYGW